MKPKKLIRSAITQKLKEDEWEVVTDQKELNELYAKKVREELAEIQESEHKDVMEFVDLIQVAFSFAKQNGFTGQKLKKAMIEKSINKGLFGRIALNNLNPKNPSNKLYFDKLTPERIHDFESRVATILEEPNAIICFPEIELSMEDLEVIAGPFWGLTAEETFDYQRGKVHGEILQKFSGYVTREDQPDFQYLFSLGVQAFKEGMRLAEEGEVLFDECPECGGNAVGFSNDMNECFECNAKWEPKEGELFE